MVDASAASSQGSCWILQWEKTAFWRFRGGRYRRSRWHFHCRNSTGPANWPRPRGRRVEDTQATADHRTPGIGGNCPEIIHLFQVGYGDGGGKGAGCLVGGDRYLVVPGGGGGDCSSSVLIAPADLHRWVLPARAVEDAGKHGRLPRRLGDTHRTKTSRNDRLSI